MALGYCGSRVVQMHFLSVVFRILRLKDWRTSGALLNRLRVWDAKQGQVRKGVNYSPPCRTEESKGVELLP